MGNSVTSLESVIDYVVARGVPNPLAGPTGYATKLALTLGQDVMSDLITERFNWKWNRQVAAPFYTNSYQQDYPQIGLANIGWLEDCDRVDINNTSIPKPIRSMNAVKQLSRTTDTRGPVGQICWMYNGDLSYGAWAGAHQVYAPLVGTTPVPQNGAMAFIDANKNILVLTTFGTTGSTQPAAAANAAEGTTVNDGTCVWTVASPNSQGFRIFPLPGVGNPVYQITPNYQLEPPTITKLSQLLNPIPESYIRWFRRGYEIACLGASANPKDKERADKLYPMWIKEMLDAAKQADKEQNAYALLPATYPVDTVYPWLRNPQDPGQPY